MSPADVIAQFLIDENLASSDIAAEWYVYVSFLPQEPNDALCIYDTSGKMDGRIMRTGEQIVHPGIQVMVRHANYVTAWNKADALARAFDAVRKTSVALDSENNYILHNVSRTGDIMHVGAELEGDRRRHLFTVNAIVTIETTV